MTGCNGRLSTCVVRPPQIAPRSAADTHERQWPNHSPPISADLELLRTAAVTAGIIASSYFRRDLKTWTKENASPVSEADIVLDKFLYSALTTARPDYGWLSEESADDLGAARRMRASSSSIRSMARAASSAARTAGRCRWRWSRTALRSPAWCSRRRATRCTRRCRGGGARLNGAADRAARRRPTGTSPLIPAPGAVHQELQAAGLDYTRGPAYPSLAYRLVQVATGKLDATVVRRGSSDWDIAGAAAILSECGIAFEDACMGAMRFNQPEIRHGALAAFAQVSLRDVLCGALIKVYGCPEPQQDLERKTT